MTISPNQLAQKAAARKEAVAHLNSNVMQPRDGEAHETHKIDTMGQDMNLAQGGSMPPQGNGGGSM
jgi:hypothetical protein